MIGSEHLSHMLSTDTTGGRVVGEELTSALKAAHDELGVSHVRAHAILGDDLGVYREVDGEPVHDFTGVDRVYDHLRSIGMYPVVELSFMPHDLASDPSTTVFEYGAIVSPPKDWQRWHDLIRDLVAHLADRYGIEELVELWSFEVWNEANLEVFWSGTPEQYLELYDVTAAAVRSVDERLRVGGPSSAASGWVEELLAHAERSGSPVDFVSTHTYGSPPLDFKPMLERYGRHDVPVWWTEWGVTPTHFNEVSDAVFAGTFLLRGMASAMGRIESLSYWVVSDHFEELGRPPALLHGGFGTRTVGELRKPRWWALALLERLHETQVRATLTGDGAGSLVEALATVADDGPLGESGCWSGTSPSTRPRRPVRPTWPARSPSRSPASSRGRRTSPTTTASTTTTPTSRRCGDGSRTPTRTGRPTSSGRSCAPPTISTRSFPTRRSSPTRTVAWSSPSTCPCPRCRASPSPQPVDPVSEGQPHEHLTTRYRPPDRHGRWPRRRPRYRGGAAGPGPPRHRSAPARAPGCRPASTAPRSSDGPRTPGSRWSP